MNEEKDFNPYVGPVPFDYDKRAYFFGREEEIKTLLSQVISERVVLFYAQSGAGKSSLLNAEIIPRLKERGYQVLPTARVGGDLPPNLKAAELENIYVFNTLWCLLEDKKDYQLLGKVSLPEFVKNLREGNNEKQCWLILDQMEEILTTFPEHSEKRRDFFAQLKQVLEDDPLLSVIIAMREDHIAGLDNYASLLPGRLESRFRIEKLKAESAIKAVSLPPTIENSTNGETNRKIRKFAPKVAEALVDDLRKIKASDGQTILGDYVETVQLQVVCYSMWKNLEAVKGEKTEEEDKIITSEDRKKYADVDEALSKFYQDIVEQVVEKTNVPEIRVRRWFGKTLITAGNRSQVKREVLDSGGLPNAAVDLILAEHLIRVEPARGGMWYELSHDRLIEPVLTNNAEWFEKNLNVFQKQAELWAKEDRPSSLLLTAEMMDQVEDWVNQNQSYLTPTEQSFWHQCMSAREDAAVAEKRLYRKFTAAAISLAIIAILASIVAVAFGLESRETSNKLAQINSHLKETNDSLLQKQEEINRQTRLLTQQKTDLDKQNDALTVETEKARKQEEIAKSEKQKALENLTEKEKQKKIADELRVRAVKATEDAIKARNTEKDLRIAADKARVSAQNFEDLGKYYKDTFNAVSINKPLKAIEGYNNILEQYKKIEESDKSQSQDDGKLSTYIALGDTYGEAINLLQLPNENIQEYQDKAIISYDSALLFTKTPQEVNTVKEKKADLYFDLAKKESEMTDSVLESDQKNKIDSDEDSQENAEITKYDRLAQANYRNASELYIEVGNKKRTVDALIALGMLSNNLKNLWDNPFDEAVNVYPEGEQDEHIRSLRAKTLKTIGDFYFSKGNNYEAYTYLKDAADLYEKSNDKKNSADVFFIAGQAMELSLNGEIDEKTENPYFSKAIKIYDGNSDEDRSSKADLISKVAEFYSSINNNKKASDYYGQLGELYKTLKDKDEASEAFINAGRIYDRSCNAENNNNIYFDKAINIYENDEGAKILTILEIARFYISRNNQNKADEYFNKATEGYLKLNDSEAMVTGFLKIAGLQADSSRKQIYYDKAIGIVRQQIPVDAQKAIGELIEIADNQTDPNQKIKLYNSVLGTEGGKLSELFNKISSSDDRALLLITIGNDYLNAGDESTAWDHYYEEALQSYKEESYRLNKAWAAIEIGRAYLNSKYSEKAENFFKEAEKSPTNKTEKDLVLIEICKTKHITKSLELNQCFQTLINAAAVTDLAERAFLSYKIGEFYEAKSNLSNSGEKGNKNNQPINYFKESAEDYKKANDPLGESLALVKIGNYTYKTNYTNGRKPAMEKSKIFYEQALKIQEKDKLGKARILVEIGVGLVKSSIYKDWVDQEKNSPLVEAINIYKEFLGDNIDEQARAYTGILHTYYQNPPDDVTREIINNTFKFYEDNISKMNNSTDDSSLCIVYYSEVMGKEKATVLEKQIAERTEKQNQEPLRSLEDRQEQAIDYAYLRRLYNNLNETQKARYSQWKYLRLRLQTEGKVTNTLADPF